MSLPDLQITILPQQKNLYVNDNSTEITLSKKCWFGFKLFTIENSLHRFYTFGYRNEKLLFLSFDKKFFLTPDKNKAIKIDISTLYKVSINSVGIPIESFTEKVKNFLISLKVKELRIFFTDNIFARNEIMEKSTNEIPCPNNPVTNLECNEPNSIWIPDNPEVPVTGSCHCCPRDGTYYIDPNDKINPCKPCGNTICGNHDGYCKGTTGSTNIKCIQNPNTFKWTADCSQTSSCQGLCVGECGWGEWFLFQICQTNTNSGGFVCQFSWNQWKSWLTWILIIALILIIIIAVTRKTDY